MQKSAWPKGAWIDALLDGDVTPNAQDVGSAASPAILKLLGLQRAFSELHFAELDASAQATSVLFKWGHLSVLEQLHDGHEADLFRAFDPMLQREVALKLRHSESKPAPASPETTVVWPTLNAADQIFIRAARRLATVRHPNVLAVQGAALHQGRAGMWMDLVQGETLAARVARVGPLPGDTLLALATQLSSALLAVHAKAIVHGNLVPAQVICEAGSDARFLLMEFANAEARDDVRNFATHTNQQNIYLRQLLTPATDIHALGTLLYFAATAELYSAEVSAIAQRRDLSMGLRALLRLLLEVNAKPLSAQQILAQCQSLRDAPVREHRARLRRTLVYVLIGALLTSSVALFFTLRARAAAEVQRNRVVAVRDFLLTVLRAPNPTQSVDPAHGLAQLFEHAIAEVPKVFSNDPMTEAQLLHQFGRSMIVFDQNPQALNALTLADQRFSQAGISISDSQRIETRSYLSDVYRTLRDFPAALALTREQAQLCLAGSPLLSASPSACVAINNDEIEATGYGGDPNAALRLVDTNFALEKSAGLERDYESVFTTYLAAVMLRDVGHFAQSRTAFIALSERTLIAVPAGHPGLLTNLMWLAWSADDLADIALAQRLNAYALQGRSMLYPSASRDVVEVRMQALTLALHAGDKARARALARALIDELPNNAAFASFSEQTLILAALAGDPKITETTLENAEKTRALALGEAAPKLAELRLNLAAVALIRGQQARAENLIVAATRTINGAVSGPNAAYLAPLLAQLQGDLAERAVPPDAALANAAHARALQLLSAQSRRLFDPVTGTWVGIALDAPAQLQQLRSISEQVFARRATLNPVKSL